MNALGVPQTLLLLGGTSDIALALAGHYAGDGLRTVWVAARPGPSRDAALSRLRSDGLEARAVDFDAADVDGHDQLLESLADDDLDMVVLAAGVLLTGESSWQDPAAAVGQVQVNFVGAVSAASHLAPRLVAQGHGVIVALSSVAGERVRRSNFVYGSTKAGFDAFFLGLGEELRGTGVRVLVVRPGFVRSKMTQGLPEAPLATTPEHVAVAVARGVLDGKDIVWVPSALRWVMSGLRHLPRPVFRRLPL